MEGSRMAEREIVNFQRGVLPVVILSLLKHEDMYGYQLVLETERRSEGKLVTQEGSLYPVLYKMLEAGYVTDTKKLVGKRMTRIYYHLEPSGEAYLQALIKEYEKVTDGVFTIVRAAQAL